MDDRDARRGGLYHSYPCIEACAENQPDIDTANKNMTAGN